MGCNSKEHSKYNDTLLLTTKKRLLTQKRFLLISVLLLVLQKQHHYEQSHRCILYFSNRSHYPAVCHRCDQMLLRTQTQENGKQLIRCIQLVDVRKRLFKPSAKRPAGNNTHCFGTFSCKLNKYRSKKFPGTP